MKEGSHEQCRAVSPLAKKIPTSAVFTTPVSTSKATRPSKAWFLLSLAQLSNCRKRVGGISPFRRCTRWRLEKMTLHMLFDPEPAPEICPSYWESATLPTPCILLPISLYCRDVPVMLMFFGGLAKCGTLVFHLDIASMIIDRLKVSSTTLQNDRSLHIAKSWH